MVPPMSSTSFCSGRRSMTGYGVVGSNSAELAPTIPITWRAKSTTATWSPRHIPREERIPFLGICLGLQVAVVDFARHVMGMVGANSAEFDPTTPYPVIDLLPEQKDVEDMGGTM